MAETSIEWTQPDKARFWRFVIRVDDDACWLWRGRPTSDGYGRFHLRGRTIRAHVASFLLAGGATSAVVRHRCDVRACVNPAHLEGGSQHENLLDATERGRLPKARFSPRGREPLKRVDGERNGRAKLTADQVAEMRRRYEGRESARSLAAAFGISKSQAHNILTGRQWS